MFTRRVSFIDAVCFDAAKSNLTAEQPELDFTSIDTTSDFNQNRWLGQELKSTLIYFDDHTRINAFLAVLGCIKAPHQIILACHIKHIRGYFKCNILLPQLQIIAQQSSKRRTKEEGACDYSALSKKEMQQALQSLHAYRGVIHLIGERGSGKSTLLGDYIVDMLRQTQDKVLLCSPSKASSANTLSLINQFFSLQQSQVSRETFVFCEPLSIMAHMSDAALVVIDEAATLPKLLIQSVISQVRKHQKKLVLATTIEGYEGTGQSYRLNHLYDNKEENTIFLEYPKRFHKDDALYQLCQQFYQLSSSSLVSTPEFKSGIQILSTIQLREKGLTAACFYLLKDAHYRTTPNDLARFYDEPALFVLRFDGGILIAAAYVVTEILAESVRIEEIVHGTRRVKNALTHQALINAYGDIDKQNKKQLAAVFHVKPFAKSKILRISRIATTKAYRRQGIATELISALNKYALKIDVDFLSTSFSGAPANLDFWLAQRFSLARVGLYPNKSNNEFAVIMLYCVREDESATQQLQAISNYCSRHLDYFRQAYTDIKWQRLIAKTQPISVDRLEIIAAIRSVTDYHRDINWVFPALFQFISASPSLFGQTPTVLDGQIHLRAQHNEDRQQLCEIMTALNNSDNVRTRLANIVKPK